MEDDRINDDLNDSGEESDLESETFESEESVLRRRRNFSKDELPSTVQTLTSTDGTCQVFLVGTAHFSESSKEDVTKTIQLTQPDVVVVELCRSRVNILSLDEETLLRESQNINLEKIRMAIKQSGVVQGILHLLLLSMSAHLTKELGMAPGGEFRTAFREAQKIPGCRVHLGDRPVGITLQRALGSLSCFQKLRLAWYLISSKDPVSVADVEKCKQKDLMEEMLREMTGEYPALSRVFVDERDLYLTHSLKQAAGRHTKTGHAPTVVVGVVGIGHTPGIVSNWNKEAADISQLMIVPGTSTAGLAIKWTLRAGVVSALALGCYQVFRLSSKIVLSLRAR